MRHSASRRLLMVTARCATAALLVVTATGAGAGDRHARMHHRHRTNIGFNNHPHAGAMVPLAAPTSRGDVCPGNARAIDCKIWPPPFEDDPDRKATSSDGSG